MSARMAKEGYPGNLHVQVTYSISDENELRIEPESCVKKYMSGEVRFP
jgi:galactose mutarotase-like enzyme